MRHAFCIVVGAARALTRGGTARLSPRTIRAAATDAAATTAAAEHAKRVKAGVGPGGGASADRVAHNVRQSQVFDEAAAYFASPAASPPEVEAVLDALAARVCAPSMADGIFRILDVGAGTGCLSRRYGAAASGRAVVQGVDLSENMVAAAREKGGTGVSYACAEVVDFAADYSGEPFDAVVFNACFGNVHSQSDVLAAAASVLRPEGRAIVTHPLGADFVDELRAQDESVVPAGLPRSTDEMRALVGGVALEPAELDDTIPYYSEWERSS